MSNAGLTDPVRLCPHSIRFRYVVIRLSPVPATAWQLW